ncbi:MAG: hypothetical protein AABW51_02750 [Nanoarchaeota archaeon]
MKNNLVKRLLLRKMNKLGLSTIVATLLIVLLTVVLTGVVWSIVTKMTKDSLDQSRSCFNIFDKVKLDETYTCYNASTHELVISLEVKDVDVGEATFGVSSSGQTKSFKILNIPSTVPFVKNYTGANTVVLPTQNSGVAYIYNYTGAGFASTSFPDRVQVAPKINGKQCDTSSTIQNIGSC